MADLTKEEVKHIAKLAKLDIDEGETEDFSRQLSSILDFVQKLDEIKTEKTKPLSNVIEKKNVFREDKIGACLNQEECLRNAPSRHKGYFKVKAVFDSV